MTRPIRLSYTPLAANLTYFASNVTGATWALSATVATDTLNHKITIRNDSATNHSAKTAIIVGTYNGRSQTETLNLPGSSATVTSVKYFDTVTSVTPSASIDSDTMDIGISDVAVSRIVYINYQAYSWPLLNTVVVANTNINFTIQHTSDNPYPYDFQSLSENPDPTWFSQTAEASKTASQESTLAYPTLAQRLLINSASAGTDVIKWNVLHCNESVGGI